MISAVLDANVLVSAAGWRGSDLLCLAAVARRKALLFLTDEILAEYQGTIAELRVRMPHDPEPVLRWIESVAQRVEPAPLGKQRSRDRDDDPYLTCALAARAECVVTHDRDLLILHRPFGIAVISPRQFLAGLGRARTARPS